MKPNIKNPNQVVRAHDLKITLDANEIYPDDPGMGTPIMVEDLKTGGTATFWCAVGEHETDEGQLEQDQVDWLDEIYDDCIAWLDLHTEIARKR